MAHTFLVPRTVVFLAREAYTVRLHRTLKIRIKLKTTLLTICERDRLSSSSRCSSSVKHDNKISDLSKINQSTEITDEDDAFKCELL